MSVFHNWAPNSGGLYNHSVPMLDRAAFKSWQQQREESDWSSPQVV